MTDATRYTVEASIPQDGFECWYIRDAHGTEIGSINGPQSNGRQRAAAHAIAAALRQEPSSNSPRARSLRLAEEALERQRNMTHWDTDALAADLVEAGEQEYATPPSAAREERTGVHLFKEARAQGWKDDGEGAYEFIVRTAYEAGMRRAAPAPAREATPDMVIAGGIAIAEALRKQEGDPEATLVDVADACWNAMLPLAALTAPDKGGPDDETTRDGLKAAIRCAKLALFVIRKHGVMPNSSWEGGFNDDLAKAEAALARSVAETASPRSSVEAAARELIATFDWWQADPVDRSLSAVSAAVHDLRKTLPSTIKATAP